MKKLAMIFVLFVALFGLAFNTGAIDVSDLDTAVLSSMNSGEAVAYTEFTEEYVVLKDNILYAGDMYDPDGELTPIIDGVGSIQRNDYGYTANGMSPCLILSEEIPEWLSIEFTAGDHSVYILDNDVLLDDNLVAHVKHIPSMYSFSWGGENFIVFNQSSSDWDFSDDVHVDWDTFLFDEEQNSSFHRTAE